MNILKGRITEIVSEDELSLVKVSSGSLTFTSIVIDSPATCSWLKNGYPVKLIFKETETIIASNQPLAISIRNRMEATILKITTGKILCELDLGLKADSGNSDHRTIRSIITRNACEELGLKENDEIIALVKTNEVSLSADD
ncbi:MAG TPA: TOBE domain-containing protein [Puia sp.]|nr:TOBE domain-containing protein [Puia sp.]